MKTKHFLLAGLLATSQPALAQTARTDVIMGLQQGQIKQLQKQVEQIASLQKKLDELTQVDGVPVRVHPIPFRKSLYIYSNPLEIPSEGGNGTPITFTRKAVLSDNNWDWNGETDSWTYPAPRQGGRVFARLTFSMTSPSHWSPCFTLRRQNKIDGVLKPFGKTLQLPCGSLLGRHDTTPGSMTVWVEWWNDNMPIAQLGQPSQTLEIAGLNYGSTGATSWYVRGLEVELYRAL